MSTNTFLVMSYNSKDSLIDIIHCHSLFYSLMSRSIENTKKQIAQMDEQICSMRRKLEEDSFKLQSFYESFIKVKNEILGIQVDDPKKDDDDEEEEEEEEEEEGENNEDAMDVEE